MMEIKLDGVCRMTGGKFDSVKVNGVGSCHGEITAALLEIDGVFKCDSPVQVEELDCDGVGRFTGDIRAKKLDVDGVMDVKGGAKVSADVLSCDGTLTVEGVISAQRLEVDGYIRAREITGGVITIKSRMSKIVNFFTKDHSSVELIEGQVVHLSGVRAGRVQGQDITISKNCRIDAVICNGTLYVDKSAEVGSISGNYTLRTE